MQRIYFFALKNDLLGLLSGMETDQSILYYEAGMLAGPNPLRYNSATDLPKIEEATGDQCALCDSYLLLEAATTITIRTSLMFNGVRRYDVDQLANPHSIILNPGGEWQDGSLISGSVATLSKEMPAQKLMRSAHKMMRKSFTRIQRYWVGPEALAAFRAGKRLCNAVQSPSEFDLREP